MLINFTEIWSSVPMTSYSVYVCANILAWIALGDYRTHSPNPILFHFLPIYFFLSFYLRPSSLLRVNFGCALLLFFAFQFGTVAFSICSRGKVRGRWAEIANEIERFSDRQTDISSVPMADFSFQPHRLNFPNFSNSPKFNDTPGKRALKLKYFQVHQK